jgi:hypothetical protein
MKEMLLEVPAGRQRMLAGEQDMSSILQEKLKTLPEITAGQQSMLTAMQDTRGIPRELEEVSVRMEDA